jgi:hypothetical protein
LKFGLEWRLDQEEETQNCNYRIISRMKNPCVTDRDADDFFQRVRSGKTDESLSASPLENPLKVDLPIR